MKLNARSRWLTLAVGVVAGWVAAAPPAWWSNRGVLTTNAPNDFAPATAGQLKHIASEAKDELDYSLNDGAGTAVAARVASFLNTNNYAAINLGQIKHVAQPFYERINAQGVVTGYPWTVATTTDDMNFAAANLGQLKNVFSFDFDADGDGMSDWWEMQQWMSLTNSGTGDSDNDGLLNNEEYAHRTNPNNGDTDGDGVSDSDELAMEMDPLVAIGVGYPVSFKIDSDCGKIYFVSTEVGTGPRWGHLVNMAETTESEARMGTLEGANCAALYGPTNGDAGYGSGIDTYITISRLSPTSLLIQVDRSNATPGVSHTYTGKLKLYRGFINNCYTSRLENTVYPPPYSTYSVTRLATNEIKWSMNLDPAGGICCLRVNYQPVRKHPFEVHLRSANGVDPMPRFFAANSTTLVRAVISPPLSGNYYWSATGGGLTFASNGVALVPIVAGATASSAVDDKSIICAFTPTNTSLTCGTNALATVLKVDIAEAKGLYTSNGTYQVGYTSTDNVGRVYCNRTYATADPASNAWNKNKQYVDFTVQVIPTNAVLPSGAWIVWEAEDPDDPSDIGMVSGAAKAVDPNDYDSTDSDGDGLDKDGGDNGTNRDGASEWEEISADYALSGAETKIKDGISKVRFNMTDDGGDNFIVKAKLKIDTGATPCDGHQTGIMAVWKKIDGEYRQMISTNTLPVDQVQAHYDKAFVEWHFHDEGSSDSYEYIESTPGDDPYCAKWTGGTGQFHHRGDGGWHFVCSARKYRTDADANPYGVRASGVAAVISPVEFVDTNAAFTPSLYAGWHIVKVNPGQTNSFSFMVQANTTNKMTIRPFEYTDPYDTPVRELRLDSTEVGLGTNVTYEVREGGVLGITPSFDANVLMFHQTIQHMLANQTNAPPLADKLSKTLVHELMHSFHRYHNCGNPDSTGTKSCAGSWSFAPVFHPNGSYEVMPEGSDFCGQHIRAIRDADGYGGE